MVTDSAFWRDLEARFRALPDVKNDLAAIRYGGKGNWQLIFGYGERLHGPYRSLARRAAIAAGAPSRINALDWWLNLLKADTDSPNLKHQVVLKSAELCAEFETRAFELEAIAAGGDSQIGLRRDRYPGHSWLYDHSHEPIADPKTELNYWRDHAWRGYRVGIEKREREGATVAEWRRSVIWFVSGLSYDLAVLQANYVIDRGFHGEEAVRAFRDESAGLLEEVISIWRASCERLAITFEDDTEDVKSLAEPFHRVWDDLRRLLHDLPAARHPETQAIEETASAGSRGSAGNCDGSGEVVLDGNKRLRSTVTSAIAARRMEAYMESHDGQTKFAVKVGTTDRTLRSFRRTGKVRRDIFDAIAGAMETTPEELVKPE